MRRILSIVFALILIILPVTTFALPNPQAFVTAGDGSIIEFIDKSAAGEALSDILALLYKIGYGIAVIILFYLAIQLMIAPAQKKAEVKAALTPYIIGLLLLVAGVPIATMIIKLFISVF